MNDLHKGGIDGCAYDVCKLVYCYANWINLWRIRYS